MFNSFTFPELLVLRKALTAFPPSHTRTSLLARCNEEFARRAYPGVFKQSAGIALSEARS